MHNKEKNKTNPIRTPETSTIQIKTKQIDERRGGSYYK